MKLYLADDIYDFQSRDPLPTFILSFGKVRRCRSPAHRLPLAHRFALPPSISGFEDCVVLSFLARKKNARIFSRNLVRLNKNRDGTGWETFQFERTSLNLSLNISIFNSFLKIRFDGTVNLRRRLTRRWEEGGRERRSPLPSAWKRICVRVAKSVLSRGATLHPRLSSGLRAAVNTGSKHNITNAWGYA